MPNYDVLVKFGDGIPDAIRGPALLQMEQTLREAGVPAQVLLETMKDLNVLLRLA